MLFFAGTQSLKNSRQGKSLSSDKKNFSILFQESSLRKRQHPKDLKTIFEHESPFLQ